MSVADASAPEGNAVSFTATLSAASGKTVTVDYAATAESGDSAGSGDFTATAGTLTFDPGATQQTFTVATTEDTLDEDDETFTVTLSAPVNVTLDATGTTATGTIEDDDDPPTVSVADASASEGNAVSFTVTLSAASGKQVSATWTASIETGDTASAADLTGTLSGTLSFAAGETEQTITVATAEDTLDEEDETFTVTLSAPVNVTLDATGTTATGTIEDGDAASTVGVADASAPEGNAVSFTATLSAASGKEVSAIWTASIETGDTASAADLTGTLSGTLSFAAGETEQTITVTTAEDTLDEEDETFTVTLSAPVNVTLDATGTTATGTIEDDDDPPTVSVADASASEGNAVSFTVTLSAASGKQVSATWTASIETGDTASAADLTGTLSGTLSFAAGETEQTITVATAEDTLDEEDETFTVTLSAPVNVTLDATGTTATGTIEDDDDPPTVSVADASASEGNAVSFTVTLSAASGKEVSATWTASIETGDTASAADLTGTLSGTLSFDPGATQQTFTVATTEDAVDEPDETFTVTLSNPSNVTLSAAATSAGGTIEDDDDPPTVGVADASAPEGNAVNFTATLSAASGKTVTVDYAATAESGDSAGTGDFTATAGTLTFDPGATQQTFTVATTEDTLDEDDETFTVTLSNPSNATLSAAATAGGTIEDDDDAPTVSVADASASEGDAASFTATLSAASGKQVSATWTASIETGDTASAADLTGTLSGTLSFAAGETEQTFTVATAEDALDEEDETFTVRLSNPANVTLDAARATATGTIEDDDDDTVAPVLDSATVNGTALKLSYDEALDEGSVPAGTAYTVSVGGTAVALAGTAPVTVSGMTATLTLAVAAAHGQVVTVSYAVPAANPLQDAAGNDAAGLSNRAVTNNTPAVPTLSITAARGSEGDGVAFTVTLSPASTSTVSATWTASIETGDTASAADLTGTLSGTVSFAADETEQTFTVATAKDALDEPDETFTVTLSAPVNVTLDDAAAVAAGTIEDDDAAPTVSVADASAPEGNAASFTATLSAASGKQVSATWTASIETGDTASAADLAGTLSGTLSFAAGETEQTITVATTEDALDEEDELFTVRLSNPSNVTLDATGTTATGTIEDDDDPPTVGVADASAPEGNAVSFTATLSAASGKTVTVDYAATAESGDSAGTGDFTATAGTLTFDPGATQQTFTVATTEDTLDEVDESFTVRLSNPANVTLDAARATATGTIEDDDDDTVAPVLDSATVNGTALKLSYDEALDEGSVPAGTAYTVSVGGTAVALAGTAPVTVSGMTATLTLAVAAAHGQVVTVSYAVPAANPLQDAAGNDAAGLSNRAVTNNTPAVPTLSITAARGSEGDGVAFTVTLSPASTSTVSATWTASIETGDTATAADLTGTLSGTVSFAAGETEQTFTVATAEDELDEPDETFTVTLSAPVNAILDAAATTATGTIEEYELPSSTVVLTVTPTRVAENATGTAQQVTVTASLNGTVRAEATPVELTVEADTATEGTDFAPVRKFTVTIAAGDTSGSGMFELAPVDDELHEPDETVVVSGSTTVSGLMVIPAGGVRVTITDDDEEPDSPPGGTGTGGGATPVPVNVTPVDATVSFPINRALTVTITFDEPVIGFALEDVEVSNGAPDNLAGSGSSYTVVLTPAANHEGTMTVTIAAAAAHFGDGSGTPAVSAAFAIDTRSPVATVIMTAPTTTGGAATTVDMVEYPQAEPGASGSRSGERERETAGGSTVVTVSYNEELDERSVPPPESFVVEVAGQRRAVREVTVNGTTVNLRVAGAVAEGQQVTVQYVPGTATAEVRDKAGNAAAGATLELRAASESEEAQRRHARRVTNAVLPRAAVATADMAAAAIAERIAAVGSGASSRGQLELAGTSMLSGSALEVEPAATDLYWPEAEPRRISLQELIGGGAFVVPLATEQTDAAEGGGGAALWGRGEYLRQSGGAQQPVAWSGDLLGVQVGADLGVAPGVLAGVAVAWARGGYGYTESVRSGDYRTESIGVHPYAGWWLPGGGAGLWATAGYGWGEVTLAEESSDARLVTGTVGGSGRLLAAEGWAAGGRTELWLRGEGTLARVEVAGGGALPAVALDSQRLRVRLSGKHRQQLGDSGVLEPELEVGLRYDDGAGANGAGLELGAEVSYAYPTWGLTVAGHGRLLATHRDASEEWGAGGVLRMALGPGKEGLSLSVAPSVGTTASGVQELWERDLADMAVSDAAGPRVDAEIGYGLMTADGGMLVTPYGSVTQGADRSPVYRAGVRLELDALNLSVEGRRQDDGASSVYGLTVSGSLRL